MTDLSYIEFNPWVMAPRLEIEYNASNQQIYIGHSLDRNATADSVNWVIQKRVYSGNLFLRHQLLSGSWTNRASLDWTI